MKKYVKQEDVNKIIESFMPEGDDDFLVRNMLNGIKAEVSSLECIEMEANNERTF